MNSIAIYYRAYFGAFADGWRRSGNADRAIVAIALLVLTAWWPLATVVVVALVAVAIPVAHMSGIVIHATWQMICRAGRK